MATYTVTARRTGDWWALEVPDVPGAYSQCKRLEQAPDLAREAIALVLDKDGADIDVTVEPQLPAEMTELVDSIHQAREAMEKIVREAQQVQVTAIHDLVNECHLSYRDVGQIVGISHQRVSQVLKEGAAHPARRRTKVKT
jgi:predicted RNase H-like HicB family nuclease